MNQTSSDVPAINAGSSSIIFALSEAGDLRRVAEGEINHRGLPRRSVRGNGQNGAGDISWLGAAPGRDAAMTVLMNWIGKHRWRDALRWLDRASQMAGLPIMSRDGAVTNILRLSTAYTDVYSVLGSIEKPDGDTDQLRR